MASLLMLATTWTPLSGTVYSESTNDSLICLSDTELLALKEEAKAIARAEVERTATEAVAEATIPLRTEIAGLVVERDQWRDAEAKARATATAETARADMAEQRVRRWRAVAIVAALLGFGAGALLS